MSDFFTVPDRVAGTRIETARDDGVDRTVLLSDLHLPADGGPVLEALARVLQQAAQEPATRVLILGDLFDAFTGPKQAGVGVWGETARLFAASAEAGVPVTLLHGNRDFMLDRAFGDLGRCRVVAGGLATTLGSQRALLLHGDELCQRDLPYQRAKRWLRHPITRGVLRRLPLRMALAAADRARARSSNVIASGDQTRFDPVHAAVEEVFVAGFDLLVFGHIHRPARGTFVSDSHRGEYAILPAFDATGVFLMHDAGGLRYWDVERGPVEDYPPRTFE